MKRTTVVWSVTAFVAGGAVMFGVVVAVRSLMPIPKAQARSVDETRAARKPVAERDATTPRVSVAPSKAAKAAMLKSDIQTMRSQLELFKVQHEDRCPGSDPNGKFDPQLFILQMTGRTNAKGNVFKSGAAAGDYPMGPYLCKFPENPFVEGPAADKIAGGTAPAPGDGATGWYFQTGTGKFSANDPEHKAL